MRNSYACSYTCDSNTRSNQYTLFAQFFILFFFTSDPSRRTAFVQIFLVLCIVGSFYSPLIATSVITAIMRSAAVTTAGVSFFTMFVVVVIASNLGIEVQLIRKQCVNRIVARTADTAVKLDACLRKSHLCATADTSADENVSADDCQKSRKCSVSLSVGIDYFKGYDRIILNLINLELLRVTEMLKDLSVFVSNCYFHAFIFLIINYISQLPSQLENSI